MPVSNNPTVSVIIPLFNKVEYVGRTIQSVIDQDYNKLEIIVVDDGSTDGSSEIVLKHSDRIRYLYQERSGVAAARNRGMELATGDFLAFLDADDPWFPHKVVWQTDFLTNHPDIQWCSTNYLSNSVDEQAIVNHQPILHVPEERRPWTNVNWFSAMARGEIAFQTSGVMLRTSMARTVGLMDTSLNYGEDFDYWVRIAERAPRCGYCSTPCYILTRDSQYSFTRNVADKYVGLAALLTRLIERSTTEKTHASNPEFLEWACATVIRRLISQGHSDVARNLIREFRLRVRSTPFWGYSLLSYVPGWVVHGLKRLDRYKGE